MTDILVVGAGFSGATIARILAGGGRKIKVIDSRDHVAGNAYDYSNELGIRVHKYGPHLFHTNNKNVFDFLSRFTEWQFYQHRVKAQLRNGRYVTLPVNRETKQIVGEENVLDIFFRPYTYKMWGMTLDELNPEVVNRVPIRDDDNELYFPDDKYQFMPVKGYTNLIENMLDHPNIQVQTATEFSKDMEKHYDHVFNSMPIDVYHDLKYGELPYRSIKFHNINLPMAEVLPTTTVNFTHTGPYTRVTEWKHIPHHGINDKWTTVTFEEPCDYHDNNMERYYPVKDKDGKNRELYNKYKAIPTENTTFIGRCGLYAYLDMHQAVNSAIRTALDFK